MKTITQALRAHKISLSLIAGVVVLGFALASCGGGGGYGGGGGMIYLPPAAFSLSMPANMATGVGTTPNLSWSASLYATGYTVLVSVNSNLSAPVVNVNVATTSYMVSPALAAGTYFWRVQATNIYGIYTSPTFTFST
jgi:hypothetical protein